MDGKRFDPALESRFDLVMADVPCSGLGIIRRKPEIRYKNPEELAALPEIQYKILEISAKYLKAGGRLIYSTCTLNRNENDRVVERFLREHPEFEPDPLPERIQRLTGGEGCKVTLFPEALGSDGFFFALLRRTGKGGAAL